MAMLSLPGSAGEVGPFPELVRDHRPVVEVCKEDNLGMGGISQR